MTVSQEIIAPASLVTEGRLLNIQLLPDETILELALVRADPEELLSEIETTTSTERFAYEAVEAQEDHWYVYQHCQPTGQAWELFQLLNNYRLMIMFPILFDDTGCTIEIIGRESDVQHGFDALPDDIRRQTSIERVSEYSPQATTPSSKLTERQRDILDAAATVGYYDVPRRGTADDVAAAVGCAPSTASEHLRKIEARILSAIAED
ncbi:helix-turn-helix domain-containing protein [Saliphagus infecundisoli]|uniref:Helix-turn-helix domain-containing protein n=1 Tax=Saliphagus infecundisoli TaxID=1849069 RepID=A0ABD5QHG4_9EURY|nr:helix-turn-helix domain-containing protein [Saliphagus infecundisoli]